MADNTLVLFSGHKSKGWWTKRCIRKHSHAPAPHENTSSPLWLWQPVAMSYHHFLSITDRETMLRLVGWWTRSPWQHKDLLTAQCGARRGARTGSGPLQVQNSVPFWSRVQFEADHRLLSAAANEPNWTKRTLNEGRSGEGDRSSLTSWLLIIVFLGLWFNGRTNGTTLTSRVRRYTLVADGLISVELCTCVCTLLLLDDWLALGNLCKSWLADSSLHK